MFTVIYTKNSIVSATQGYGLYEQDAIRELANLMDAPHAIIVDPNSKVFYVQIDESNPDPDSNLTYSGLYEALPPELHHTFDLLIEQHHLDIVAIRKLDDSVPTTGISWAAFDLALTRTMRPSPEAKQYLEAMTLE